MLMLFVVGGCCVTYTHIKIPPPSAFAFSVGVTVHSAAGDTVAGTFYPPFLSSLRQVLLEYDFLIFDF